MSIYDTMVADLQAYPAASLQIEIVDFEPDDGDVLNINEHAAFKVKVTNNGPLTLTGMTLRIAGRNDAKVKLPGPIVVGPTVPPRRARIVLEPFDGFVTEFVSDALPDIRGHGGTYTTAAFELKAPADDSNSVTKTLVKASLEDWDATLDHILNGHSDPQAAVNGTYAAEVVAD